MDNTYDYIIIGGGPAGMACGQLLSKEEKKILILERESNLGGCHRVIRVNDIFTEHSPRIYLGFYLNFMNLLNDMGYKWGDFFVKYPINTNSLLKFDLKGISKLARLYVNYAINKNYGKDISLYNEVRTLSKEYIELLDSLCRTIDGGSIYRYSVNKFFASIDKSFLYSVYLPKVPNDNDDSFIKKWESFLIKNGVDISLNSEVTIVDPLKNIVKTKDNIHYRGKNIIIAVPPKGMYNILKNSDLEDAFVEKALFKRWVEKTGYIEYLSMTFHWDKVINIKGSDKLVNTDWGLQYINLSKYMKNINSGNFLRHTISITLGNLDKKSSVTNKTVNESTEQEIITEAFRQFKVTIGEDIPEYTAAIISPTNYKNIDNDKWELKDKQFFDTYDNMIRDFPMNSEKYPNLYNVGTHNNKAEFPLTTMETAVTNAIVLCGDLTGIKRNILKPKALSDLIFIFLFIILLVLLYILVVKST